MSTDPGTLPLAVGYAGLGGAAVVVGALVSVRVRPSDRIVGLLQHAAAGTVFAGLVVDVFARLLDRAQQLPFTASGMVAGLVLMLLLRRATSQGGTGGSVGLGLVVAVVADVLVDGVLIGLSVALATGTGLIFALALAPEMGLLGLTAAEGVTARLTGPRTIAVSAAIGVAIAAGGAVGWAVAQAPPALGTTVLGVGASVVMYLVLEELLREAHRNESGVTEVAVLFGCFLPLFLAGVAVG